MSQCKFTKEDSLQCQANSITNSDYCFSHNPDYAVAKREAVIKGGLAPKRILLNNEDEIVLVTAADAKLFLSRVINGVWQGSIPATPVANTLGFLVRCFLDAHDKSEIEERLEKIEEIVEERIHDQ